MSRAVSKSNGGRTGRTGRTGSRLSICAQCVLLLISAAQGIAGATEAAVAMATPPETIASQPAGNAAQPDTKAPQADTKANPSDAQSTTSSDAAQVTNIQGNRQSGVQVGVQLDQSTSPSPPPEQTLYASPTRKDRIGRILAPVMVNGKGPYRFIVDTGASNSTVSPQLAEALGLHTTDATIKVNGITGTAQVPSVLIDRLQAGDIVYKNEEFPVVWAPVMAGADGILGIAGFKSERLLVDFDRNRVVISRSMRMRTPFGFVRIPMSRLENGLVMINAQIGWIRARAILDTGSERTLGNLALLEALRASRGPGNPSKATQVYGSTSEIVPGQLVTSPTITLGRVKISRVDMVYGNFHIFDVWKMQDRPALIIGMDILGSVRALAIDFQEQEVYVEDSLFGVDARRPQRCAAVQIEPDPRCAG